MARAGDSPDKPETQETMETGVPQLDRVLGGGLPRGGTAMVIGAPGTGKTVLAQQIAFYMAQRGATALYLTGYSETHAKLLAHMRGFRFFAPEVIGTQVQLGSLPGLLRQGADETVAAIVAMARAQRAALVVLDGFASIRRFLDQGHAGDAQATAHFLYTLGAKLELLRATLLVVAEGEPEERDRYPELTICDLIVALRRDRPGQHSRSRRLLEVVKARGAAPLEGLHPYVIDAAGIHVSPRWESVVSAAEPGWPEGVAGFGPAALDALLGGGPSTGTTTLAAGRPGTGKTLLGLHFAAEGARRDEPVLWLGFMESAAQLRARAQVFGLDLAAAEAAGRLRFLVLPGYDLEADRLAALLQEDVERRGVRRLVLDSAAELERSLASQARTPEFMAALVRYLRTSAGHGVTTYITLDVPTIVGPELSIGVTPLSVMADNVLLLRYAEYGGALHRLVSVLKMRFSDFDRTIHEYTITPGEGITLVGPAPPVEGLPTGIARLVTPSGSVAQAGSTRAGRQA